MGFEQIDIASPGYPSRCAFPGPVACCLYHSISPFAALSDCQWHVVRTGNQLGPIKRASSAKSAHSSRPTTPRTAGGRPGTMSNLLEMGSAFGGISPAVGAPTRYVVVHYGVHQGETLDMM